MLCFQLTSDFHRFLFVCSRSLSATTITFCEHEIGPVLLGLSILWYQLQRQTSFSTTFKKVAENYHLHLDTPLAHQVRPRPGNDQSQSCELRTGACGRPASTPDSTSAQTHKLVTDMSHPSTQQSPTQSPSNTNQYTDRPWHSHIM
jgi:hypothetical protein